ncbi:MAG: ROK family transcriptional regulator [Halanaerobiaceae bacterium]
MGQDSFTLMKEQNERKIFQIIHREGGVSRKQIAELTGLSPATVSNITGELLERGLIREGGKGKSRGGRRPVLLRLNPGGGFVLGIEWGINEIRGVLLDLDLNIIVRDTGVPSGTEVDNFFDITFRLLDNLLQEVEESERVFGLGTGIHGPVNPETGVALYAPHFGWREVPVGEILAGELEFPVFADNDVRMMASSERWRGRDNFVFINTGPGIGAAVVLEGELLYGRDWSAGEFGHMVISENGPTCNCGSWGCLEAHISVSRLVEEYSSEEVTDSFAGITRGWMELAGAARRGEKVASAIIEDAARHLGIGVVNLVNLLNPESIVIGGAFVEVSELMFPVVEEVVSARALRTAGEVEIIPAASGDWSGAVGAGARVLENVFAAGERV